MRLRHRSRSRGQALVEFSLVFLLFALVVFALFDLGSAVFSYTAVTNAAREGARLAIVNQDKPSIIQRAQDQTVVAEIEAPSVDIDFYQPDAAGNPDTTRPCGTPVATGCVAVVRFQTTYHPITPLIGSFLFPHGVTFYARTVMTVEYSCPSAIVPVAADCPRQP